MSDAPDHLRRPLTPTNKALGSEIYTQVLSAHALAGIAMSRDPQIVGQHDDWTHVKTLHGRYPRANAHVESDTVWAPRWREEFDQVAYDAAEAELEAFLEARPWIDAREAYVDRAHFTTRVPVESEPVPIEECVFEDHPLGWRATRAEADP